MSKDVQQAPAAAPDQMPGSNQRSLWKLLADKVLHRSSRDYLVGSAVLRVEDADRLRAGKTSGTDFEFCATTLVLVVNSCVEENHTYAMDTLQRGILLGIACGIAPLSGSR